MVIVSGSCCSSRIATIAARSAADMSLASDAVDGPAPPRCANDGAIENRRLPPRPPPRCPGALNPDVSSRLSTHVPEMRAAASDGDSFCVPAAALNPAQTNAALASASPMRARLCSLMVSSLFFAIVQEKDGWDCGPTRRFCRSAESASRLVHRSAGSASRLVHRSAESASRLVHRSTGSASRLVHRSAESASRLVHRSAGSASRSVHPRDPRPVGTRITRRVVSSLSVF